MGRRQPCKFPRDSLVFDELMQEWFSAPFVAEWSRDDPDSFDFCSRKFPVQTLETLVNPSGLNSGIDLRILDCLHDLEKHDRLWACEIFLVRFAKCLLVEKESVVSPTVIRDILNNRVRFILCIASLSISDETVSSALIADGFVEQVEDLRRNAQHSDFHPVPFPRDRATSTPRGTPGSCLGLVSGATAAPSKSVISSGRLPVLLNRALISACDRGDTCAASSVCRDVCDDCRNDRGSGEVCDQGDVCDRGSHRGCCDHHHHHDCEEIRAHDSERTLVDHESNPAGSLSCDANLEHSCTVLLNAGALQTHSGCESTDGEVLPFCYEKPCDSDRGPREDQDDSDHSFCCGSCAPRASAPSPVFGKPAPRRLISSLTLMADPAHSHGSKPMSGTLDSFVSTVAHWSVNSVRSDEVDDVHGCVFVIPRALDEFSCAMSFSSTVCIPVTASCFSSDKRQSACAARFAMNSRDDAWHVTRAVDSELVSVPNHVSACAIVHRVGGVSWSTDKRCSPVRPRKRRGHHAWVCCLGVSVCA